MYGSNSPTHSDLLLIKKGMRKGAAESCSLFLLLLQKPTAFTAYLFERVVLNEM